MGNWSEEDEEKVNLFHFRQLLCTGQVKILSFPSYDVYFWQSNQLF